MTSLAMRVESRRLLPGCSAGLSEPTAIVEVALAGDPDDGFPARIRTIASQICPTEPLFGIAQHDWPSAFLVEDETAGSVWKQLGQWVVAITVAVQRWGGDPAWRGRVVDADGSGLRLALPWRREPLVNDAVGFAVLLVENAAQVSVDSAATGRLIEMFTANLEAIRAGGVRPETLRFLQAAAERNIPCDVLSNCVQLGWGANAERLDAGLTGHTSFLASNRAGDRGRASRLLADSLVPVPAGGTDAGSGDDRHRLLVVNGSVIAAARERSGGSAENVLAAVHPDNRLLAERAARTIGLDIAGVDLVIDDVGRPWREGGGVIGAVDAQPDFRPYWIAEPDRDIHGEVIDMLFAGRTPRIPTTAITGTNGKSTTASMLHAIWTAAGRVSGVCTTHESRIGGEVFTTRNLSGYPGARIILNDPMVEVAVLEVPRRGLIVFGHPCARYDVGMLLNVTDDHIGIDGIDSVEQMAELKAEVLQRAREAVVVNGDDPVCLAVLPRAGAPRRILVTRDPSASHVVDHLRDGGEVVRLRSRDGSRWITVVAGDRETDIVAVDEVPATLAGRVGFNEINAMFAVAGAWAHGIDPATIAAGLRSYGADSAANPGRFELIGGLPFQLVVDYAHNPAGVREVCAAVTALPVGGRRILGTVNVATRHRAHAAMVAPDIAVTFDHVVVGCDPARVRKSPDYAGADPLRTMVDTLAEALTAAGLPADRLSTDTDPRAAVRAALSVAGPGDLVVLLGEPGTLSGIIEEFVAEWESR